MKNNLKFIGLFGIILMLISCESFLNENPRGSLGDDQLVSVDDAEKLIIAAYSIMGNDHFRDGMNSLWPYGDLRSEDAYKGGAGTGDMGDWNNFETFVTMRIDLGVIDVKWYREYCAISRINNALKCINKLTDAEYPLKQTRMAEMRFLRAHCLFELKILFNKIVWVDESIPAEQYINVSNDEYSSKEMWEKIIEEFRFCATNLPDFNGDIGRANKFWAKAYLAKTLLYAAYEQDERNNVISINTSKLEEVVSLVNELGAKYSLSTDFAYNFLCEFENGPESIFAIQCSLNDGTLHGRLDMGAMLNYPMNSEYGCCGFHQPSQHLVNSFKTDASGLPMFDGFNNVNIETPDDMNNNNIDPRLMHTVAIPGLPYKYRSSFLFQENWNRQPETYGPFMSLKEVVIYDCPCFHKFNPFMSSAKNRDVIRYDDALLWKAEALIELGRHTEALPVINSIRERAKNSTAMLINENGDPTGRFYISLYEDGVNCTWTQEFARNALRWERRMEFAMEGFRFFDLVRWGIAEEYVNDYLVVEKTRRAYLRDAVFTKNRDEYFPIPLAQINFSKKLYKQNYGWPVD